MKKVTKLLVVLLLLAAVMATLVIVAGASSGNVARVDGKEYETLDAALDAAAEGSEVVLIDDASIEATYRVDKSVTIDLNGKKLEACNNAFAVVGGVSFTIKGSGKIDAGNTLITTDKDSVSSPLVTIDGSGYGIDITVGGGILTSSKSGTLRFKNLNIESGPVPANKAIFYNDAASDAKLYFTAVDVYAFETVSSYGAICGFGNDTYMNMELCNFVSNRSVMTFKDCKTTELVLEANNSYFASRAKKVDSSKNHEVGVIGLYAEIACKMIFNNSILEGSFRPVCVNATADAQIVLNNSYIKNNGIAGGEIARTCNIIVNAGSGLTSLHVPSGALAHTNAENDNTFIILKEGARMNKSIYDVLYVKNRTVGVRYGVDVVADDGTTTLELKKLDECTDYKAIYDPAGNTDAPFVLVKRTFDENGVETTPEGESFSEYAYMNTYSGMPEGLIWDNGTSGPVDVGAGKPHATFLSWNKNGKLFGAEIGGNGALRYEFDEPEGKNGTTLMFSDFTNSTALPHDQYQVFVGETDIAFDSDLGFVAGTIGICARGANNGGNYSGASITIGADGVATITDTTNPVQLKMGEWNRVTIVIYSDKGSTGTSCKGTAHFYVNGEYLGTGKGYSIGTGNGDIAYLWGVRYDVNKSDEINNVGATMLFDNTTFAAYSDYKGDANDDPLSYSATGAMPVNKEKACDSITIGGRGFETLNEAMKYGATVGIYPQLKGGVLNQLVTENGTIRANGYSIGTLAGSNFAVVRYNEASELYTYDFNSKYNSMKVTYQWYIGNKNNVDDLKNPAKYVESEVPLGTTPTYPGGELAPGTKKIGQDIYIAAHLGWSTDLYAEEPDELGAVSISDAVNMADEPIKVFPVYEKEYTKVTGFTMIILDVDGNFSRGVNPNTTLYGSDWTTRAGKAIKLDYGETLVLMSSSFKFVGNFNSLRTNTTNPKTFAIDLNGHAMNIDSAVNSTGKTPNYFQVKSGETFYFYSSVPGATVSVRGMTSNDSTAMTGGTLFSIYGSGKNTVADNISDATNNNTHLKIGTVTRFGETYPGSNLTISGDTLVDLQNGDKTCTVEIDGITFIKAINKYGAVIINRYFNGDVEVSDSKFFIPNGGVFVDGKNTGIEDVNGDGTKDKNDVTSPDCVRVAATMRVDGCYLFTAQNGNNSNTYSNLSAGDYTFKSILYTNCVTNGRIGGSNTGLAIRIGDGCLVYNPAAEKLEGVTAQTYNRDMTFGGYTDADTLTVYYIKDFTKKNNSSITYNQAAFTFALKTSEATDADLVLPNFVYKHVSEENTFDVTFVGADGAVIKTESYAKGALPSYPADIGSAPEGVATKRVYDGTFAPALPEGVVSDITLAPNYTVEANIEGMQANLSLNSDFNINLIIPIAYKDHITEICVGETKLEIKENTDSIYVSVPTAATAATDEIEFVISITEGDVSVTETVKYSVEEYAEAILKNEDAKYTAEDRKLIWYVVKYAAEAALYFEGEADEALEALLTTYADAKGAETERVYENVIENMGLDAVFTAATLKLTEVPAYVLTVKAGFEGTVTVTTTKGTYTFEVAASETPTKLEIAGMKAYEFAETAAITAAGTIGEAAVEITAGSFNLATFANYHSQNAANSTASAEALNLINALYDYVTEASEYEQQ